MFRTKTIPTLVILFLIAPAWAYVDLAPTLSRIVRDAQKISIVEVEKFSREKGAVILKEVRALKGQQSNDPIKHKVSRGETNIVPRPILEWAEPGRRGTMFVAGNTTVVCIGRGWYQVQSTSDGWWTLGPDRIDLPLAYYGSLSRLNEGIELMLAGKDAVLVMVPHGAEEGASFDLALNRANYPGLIKVQRLRANLRMPTVVMAISANPAYLIGQGQAGEEEIPALLAKLKSPDPMVRAEAADDLRSLNSKARSAAKALTPLLEDSSPLVRMLAAAALLHIAPDDAAREVLAKGLGEKDPVIRRHAAQAAGLAGSAAAPLAEKLSALLEDSDELTRLAALQAIGTLGPAASGAMQGVLKLLDKPEFASDAADALGRMGPAASAAHPHLAKLLSSDQIPLRWAAVRAMSQIGGEGAGPAVQFMIGLMKNNPNEVDGYNMMVYLILLGPAAKDALPTLPSVWIKNPVLRQVAAWAIECDRRLPWLDGGGGRFPMGGMMGGEPEFARFIYEACIHEMGENLRPASATLAKKIMEGTAGNVPLWAYKILAKFPEQSIPILSPGLQSDKPLERERAAVALGYMGQAGSGAKAQVAGALAKASSEREKRLIQWCLREIGG